MTDAQIWQNYKLGDRAAYESIYKEHVTFLLHYGYKIATDSDLVQDAVHDLFVELWKNRSSIGQTDNIRAYLTVSIRRKVIKAIQTKQKSSSDIAVEDVPFTAELAIDDIIIAGEEDDEKKRQLKSAMAQLSDRQREVLYMKYYAQMNNDDISAALGINNQSVRNLVYRSIEQLKKVFAWCLLILNFF